MTRDARDRPHSPLPLDQRATPPLRPSRRGRHLDGAPDRQGRELDRRSRHATAGDAGKGIDLDEGVPGLHEAVEVDLEAGVGADGPVAGELGGEVDELVDGDVLVVDDGDAQDVGEDVLVRGDDALVGEVVLVGVHVHADDGVAAGVGVGG